MDAGIDPEERNGGARAKGEVEETVKEEMVEEASP